MPGYLNTPSGWFPVRTSSVAISTPGGYQAETTLGRVRQVRRLPEPRQWRLSINLADPYDLLLWQMILSGLHGLGPFQWLDPWAVVTNLLTPAQSTFQNPPLVGASLVTTQQRVNTFPDGSLAYGESVMSSGSNQGGLVNWPSPYFSARAGVPVTCSGWIRLQSSGTLTFRRSNTTSGSKSQVMPATDGQWVRFALTLSPLLVDSLVYLSTPAGTVAVSGLAITYTDGEPRRWAPGYRPAEVIVEGLDHVPVSAWQGDARTKFDVTLTEVGAL